MGKELQFGTRQREINVLPIPETPMDAHDWSPETINRYRALMKVHVRKIGIGRRFRKRFDTSDVVHDAFVKALEKLDTFRGKSEAELVAWLRKITGNALLDILEHEGNTGNDPNREETIRQDSESIVRVIQDLNAQCPSTPVISKEDKFILYSAIDRLPEAEQDVIISHYLLSLPVLETADRLGRTPKSVAMLLYRGRLRLGDVLGRTGGGR
jgi:RNA polymerase sigma-70 factor (ECF subfamily)